MDRQGYSWPPSSHNSWTSLGQTVPDCSTPTGHGAATTINRNQWQNSQWANARHEGTANRRDPNSLQCFRCQGCGHMAWECPTATTALNQSGELRECGPTSHQHQPQHPTVGPQHSLPDLGTRLTSMSIAQRMGQQGATPVPFLNPEPIAHLVGCSNGASVIMDGQRKTTLIDSGAQVSSISSQFCENLTLKIQSLGRLLELEGTGVPLSHTSGMWRLIYRFYG